MEFKGTKGEWIANYSHESETYISCNGLRIAEVKHYKSDALNDPSTEEGRANAKIMVAAPKLLEELITLLSNIDEMGNTGEDMRELRTYLSDARKAINEALN
jgi:hypothetical protein